MKKILLIVVQQICAIFLCSLMFWGAFFLFSECEQVVPLILSKLGAFVLLFLSFALYVVFDEYNLLPKWLKKFLEIK